MKKKFLSFALVISMMASLLIAVPMTANAAMEFPYEYTVENGEATITNYDNIEYGSITIPSTLGGYPVTAIESNAFKAYNKKKISIPASVTSIGVSAFGNCHNLTEINVDENNPSYSSVDGNLFNKDKTTIILYARGKNNTTYTIPSSVTKIEPKAFHSCDNLTSITIQNGVTDIGYDAFRACKNLTSITIPDSVTHIGNQAFWTCYSLNNVIFPPNVTNVGASPFGACDSLTTITISEGTTIIPSWTFSDCYSLTNITIPDSVTNIENKAFSRCDNLTNVYYRGTKDDWNAITIGTVGTIDLTNTTVYFLGDPEHAHDWNNGVITLQPTHLATGSKLYTCTTCSKTYTEAIPMIPHSYGNWEKYDADTHIVTCTCGDVLVEDHEYEVNVIRPPTYETDGIKEYICIGCKHTKTEVIDKLVPEYKQGDPNNDGEVDVKDVMLLRRHVAGGYGVVIDERIADVNKDSEVDVKDVMLLRRYVAGGYGIEL